MVKISANTQYYAFSIIIIYRWGVNQYSVVIDNNHTERLIKPIVMSRKNFLFCNSVAGANALCLHFSLVQTAKLHKLDPYEYYVALLKRIPHC